MFLLNIYIPFVAQYNFCAKFCIKTSLNISNLNVIFCQCFLSSFTQFRPPHTHTHTLTHSHTESCSIMLACRAHECHVLFKQYALSGWSGTKLLTYLQFHLNTAHPYTTNVGARHKQFLHTTVGQPSTSLIDICLSLCFF